MQDSIDNTIDRHRLIVQPEEAFDLLDELEIYMYSMQAEMHYAGERADELAPMCHEVDRYNEPIVLDPARPNERFRKLLALIGADTPETLSAASGVDVKTCNVVLNNPIGCDASSRVSVVSGLERHSADAIWSKPSGKGAYSVGDMLYLWMRENFRTPFIYVKDVYSGKVKTKLVGAASSLTLAELLSLDKLDAVTALREMANSAALQRCPKSTQ